ncbi:MAG: hypothetical protein AAFY88_24460, partial [Acidobacteriota bacterium]
AAAAFAPSPGLGVIDQDLAHGAGGQRQEVGPVGDADPLRLQKPGVDLMHQRGRIQRIQPGSTATLAARQESQLLVDLGKKGVERGLLELTAGQHAGGHGDQSSPVVAQLHTSTVNMRFP